MFSIDTEGPEDGVRRSHSCGLVSDNHDETETSLHVALNWSWCPASSTQNQPKYTQHAYTKRDWSYKNKQTICEKIKKKVNLCCNNIKKKKMKSVSRESPMFYNIKRPLQKRHLQTSSLKHRFIVLVEKNKRKNVRASIKTNKIN